MNLIDNLGLELMYAFKLNYRFYLGNNMQEGEIKRAFEVLRDQALILVKNIGIFKILYHEPNNIELLEETAEGFFGGNLIML